MIQKKSPNGVLSALDMRSLDDYETRRTPEGRGSRRGNNEWSVLGGECRIDGTPGEKRTGLPIIRSEG